MFETVLTAHGDGSYPRLMNQLAKMQPLILDDWRIQTMTKAQRLAYPALDSADIAVSSIEVYVLRDVAFVR